MEKQQPTIDLTLDVEIKKEGDFKTINAKLSSDKKVLVSGNVCINNSIPAANLFPQMDFLQSMLHGIEAAKAQINVTIANPDFGFAFNTDTDGKAQEK